MPIEPAQLEHVWLSDLEFHQNEAFNRANLGRWAYVVNADADVGVLMHPDDTADFGDTVTWTVVTLAATIEWSRGEAPDDGVAEADANETEEAPFELVIELHGLFAWHGSAPDDQIANLWLEYNAEYLLWPYLRQHIAAVTGMSNLPPLTIYTMNVPERPDLDEDDSSENVIEADAEPSRRPAQGT